MARLRQRLRKRKDTRSFILRQRSQSDATKWHDVRCRQLWYIIISAVVRVSRQQCYASSRNLGVDSTRFLSRDASVRHGLEFRTFAETIIAIGALQICLRLFVRRNGNTNCVCPRRSLLDIRNVLFKKQ